MSTLLFERSLPRFAAARVVSSFGSGRGAGVGPLRLVERDAPGAPGRGLGPRRPRALGHLRLRPGHPRRAQLALLRGHRLLPLRARATRWSAPWPRTPSGADGARAGRGQPGRAAAGARVRGPGDRAAVPRLPGRAGRQLRARWPSATSGPACRPASAPTPAAAGRAPGWSRTPASSTRCPTGLSDADAVTVEPVACAVHAVLGAPIAEGDVVAVLGAGTLGLLVTAALSHLAVGRALPLAVGRCSSGARYAHQQRLARELGCTEALPPDQLARAVRRHSRSLSYGGPLGRDGHAVGRCRRGDRLRGQPRVDRPVPGHGAAPGDGVAGRHAGQGDGGPGAAVAPRGAPGRGVRLRHRARRAGAADDRDVDVRAGLRGGRRPAAPAAWCRPPIPLARFEDAVAHAGAAGRRGAVKIAFDVRKGPTR